MFLNLISIIAGTLWFGALTFGLSLSQFNARVLSIEYLLALVVFFGFLYLRRNVVIPNFNHRYLFIGNAALILVAPVLLTAAVVLPTNWYLIRPFDERAAFWGGIIALGTMIMWRLPLSTTPESRWGNLLAWGVTLLAFVAPFAMMDSELSYDVLHYTAYMGPATAVAAGRVPLIDVFSQYGQSYLIYDLALLFLPKTYHAAALVTTICNATYVLCALIILRKLIRNRLVFLILGASLPFFFWMTYHYTSNNTPSHGGLRYLPIYLVSASLVLMGRQRLFTPFSVATIFLAWAWSFEAAVYSSFIYVVFLIARACSNGTNLNDTVILVARYASLLLALLAFFVAFVSVVYLVATGSLPRYDLYLSLVLAYVGPDPFMDYTWFQDGFFAWVPILAGYFVTICMVARQCCSRSAEKPDWVQQAAVLFALGVTIGIYCLISTQTFILKAVILPFYLLLYWGLDRAVGCRAKGALVSISEIGLGPVLIFLFAVLSGVSISNFSGDPVYATPNTSVLRHLLSYGRLSPKGFKDRLYSFCSQPGIIEPGNACSPGSNIADPHYVEFKILLDRWQHDVPTLMTFHPQDTIMQVYYQKPHTLPLSFSYVDGFSPQLFKHIVDRSRKIMAEDIHEGQTVVITKDLATLNELQWALLKELATRWTLEQVDQTEHLAVYRLVKDTKSAVGPVLTLPDRAVKIRNSL